MMSFDFINPVTYSLQTANVFIYQEAPEQNSKQTDINSSKLLQNDTQSAIRLLMQSICHSCWVQQRTWVRHWPPDVSAHVC